MKLVKLLVVAVFLVPLSLFANSSLTSHEIDNALHSSNLREFRRLHQTAVSYLMELEESENLEGKSTSINLLISPKLYSLHHFLLGDFVISADGELCFFGGWMTYKSDNKCPKPWKMRNNLEFKRKLGAHVYSAEYNCGGSDFRCNPLIFGSTSEGNGKCISQSPVKSLSKRCADESSELIDAHIKKLKEDPILRNKFSEYLAQLLSKCGTSRKGTCKILRDHLGKLVTKARDVNDVNLCRILVEPVLGVDSMIDIGARLNSPPAASDSEEENDEVNSNLTDSEGEQKMFENYKKMGGDPKAFQHVMCFYKKHKSSGFKGAHGRDIRINDGCKIVINDYNKPSNEKRMFIMDRCTGKVAAMQTSHGRGKGSRSNTHASNRYVSNEDSSHLSPSGFFILGDWHQTKKFWKPGIKMHGLQKGVNDQSYRRGIVLHRSKSANGPYCSGGVATSDESSPTLKGKNCGRTHGCIGVPVDAWEMVTGDIKGKKSEGPLLYTYSVDEAAKPASYCGGDNLWQ